MNSPVRTQVDAVTTPEIVGPPHVRYGSARDAVLTSLIVLAIACSSVVLLYSLARSAFVASVQEGLLQLARAAAAVVDGDLHRTFVSPEQETTLAYETAVRPLRSIMQSVPDIRYLYTVTLCGPQVRFILDATPPGDADGDGIEDHSHIQEIYEAADAEMLAALREGRAVVMDEPRADRWGPVLSAYAPFLDSSRRLVGVVGVDITAERYATRLVAMRTATLTALTFAAVLSGLVGMQVFRMRFRTRVHAWQREVDISRRQQVEEQLLVHSRALEAANLSLQALAEAAQQATRAKSEFLANMSHEIRTPMTAILGFAEILMADEGRDNSPSLRNEALRVIQRNGRHLLQLINDILDLSKIESGKFATRPVPCSPMEIVADVVRLMHVQAEQKGLAIVVEWPASLPEIICTDPLRLRQILINVIGNAIKFTLAGTVRIVTRLDQDPTQPPRIRFDIIDTGIGMSAEQLATLFQAFSQADGSVTRRFGGTGLGLAISWQLARLLGGNVSVGSVLGQGSTVSVTVETGPLDDVRMVQVAPGQSRPEPGHALESSSRSVHLAGRILLAEDGPDNQRLISFLLRKAGAEVVVADDGQVALVTALDARDGGRPFDVILMDMQMPVMDGYEATRQLRQAGYSGAIIALTAHALSGDREKCLAAGCDDYATKPIQRTDLFLTISRYLCGGAASTDAVTPAGCG